MALFGIFGNKSKAIIPSFPAAQNSLGIKSEAELRERAKVILNDTDGVIEAEPRYQACIKSYKSGDTFTYYEDIQSIAVAGERMIRFSGYFQGAKAKNNKRI